MNDVIPTKETLQKGNYQHQETAKAGVFVLRNVYSDLLERYFHRKNISSEQYSAGKHYVHNYVLGHSHPSIISSYKERSTSNSNVIISDVILTNKQKYNEARKQISKNLLTFFEYAVLDDMPLQDANKKTLRLTNKKAPFKKFKMCLDILAYYYGYVR
jgi:hypothetical protein